MFLTEMFNDQPYAPLFEATKVSAKERILNPGINVGDMVYVKAPGYDYMLRTAKFLRIGPSGLATIKLTAPLESNAKVPDYFKGATTLAVPPSWLHANEESAWPKPEWMKRKEQQTEGAERHYAKDPSGYMRNMHTGRLEGEHWSAIGDKPTGRYAKRLERYAKERAEREAKVEPVAEAYALKKRVKIVGAPAPYAWIGKYGWIGEIRHGLHNKSPKMYTIDLDHGGGSIMLPREALRLVKEPVVDESEFSIHGSGSNFDSAGFARHMAKLRAQAELKKTDPMRALVNDLHAEDKYKDDMRKRAAAARAPSDSKSDPNWDPYNAYSANSIYSQHKD